VNAMARHVPTNRAAAKRRVSFAPEATLHTWDVVEYLRDATSSSASSDATRRASNVSHASANAQNSGSDVEEPPSTPPERVEEPEPEPGSSPASQRDLHQKKNRRPSSGIPPMNFNNPDDLLSSSPLSSDNASPGAIGQVQDDSDENEGIEDSPGSNDDSQSSARLDAALRQAVTHAGTQRLDLDAEEDVSMVMVEDDITASFKPWAQKSQQVLADDQENEDPFSDSPAHSSDDDADDMSMDITRAVGRIIARPEPQSPVSEDMSMDLTMALGGIRTAPSNESVDHRKSLKRPAPLLEASQGSPAKRPSNRRASLRQRTDVQGESIVDGQDDQTMEFTMAIGTIKSQTSPKAIQPADRRTSLASLTGEATMDFTVAVGTIKNVAPTNGGHAFEGSASEDDEDMSMEFTTVVGPGIRRLGNPNKTPEKTTESQMTLTPTLKNATPQKSPGRLKSLSTPQSSSPQKAARATPSRSPGRPRRVSKAATPEKQPTLQRIEDFEPSPFVRSTPQSILRTTDVVSTPTRQPQDVPLELPNDPITAHILNRRRSSLSNVHFSPLAAPREEPMLKSTTLLTNSIKLLSTPRKQAQISPIKRTPKQSQTPQKIKTPKQKTPTPNKSTPRESMSPKKRVVFGQESKEEQEVFNEPHPDEDSDPIERISLQEFLDLTKIRFMDLSTTKRRHTAAPVTFHDTDLEEKEESLDQYVIAGACTLPEYELYQHACHEMKKYISDGRHFVRTMEANVMEENPMLFSEYLTAPPDQRIIMDNQFKNLKTNARLEARGEWYGWRSTLLQDLKIGLLSTMEGFQRDEAILADQEKLLDVVLPPLEETKSQLSKQDQQLQQRHDELNSCDRDELEQARQQLISLDAELEEKRKLVARLQEELARKETCIEAAKERKVECHAEIKAAERVREECRGWSTTEVNDLHGEFLSVLNRL